MVTGAAGQQPAAGDEEKIEILIADNNTFAQTSLIAVASGFYSSALIDTNKRLACFQIKQPIAVPSNGRIYFTVKCAASDALTADQATITVSQS